MLMRGDLRTAAASRSWAKMLYQGERHLCAYSLAQYFHIVLKARIGPGGPAMTDESR